MNKKSDMVIVGKNQYKINTETPMGDLGKKYCKSVLLLRGPRNGIYTARAFDNDVRLEIYTGWFQRFMGVGYRASGI